MADKSFLDAYEFIKLELSKLEVNRCFNSIGSNVFFEFGKSYEIIFKNGKKNIQKEWSIWIGNVSWKITKDGKYIVGSGDNREFIQLYIQELLGKRFQLLQFNSQFLDAKFDFMEGYCLTTFFDRIADNQWTIFLPTHVEIGTDGHNYDAMKEIKERAAGVPIIEEYSNFDLPQEEFCVKEISYDGNDQPIVFFGNNSSITLENCTWRFEKNQDYKAGYLDNDSTYYKEKIGELIGKKLIQVKLASNLTDAKFQFEDQYVVKTFACSASSNQWKITLNSKQLFQSLTD